MKQLLCFGFFLMPFLGAGQVVDTARVRKAVDSLVQVCRGLTGQGKFDEALEVIEVAKQKAREGFGVESVEYASCLFRQGTTLFFKGEYLKAELLLIESKDIQGNLLGKENLDYANSLNNLALVYEEMGNYDKAEFLYLETKFIWGKVLGKEHSDYAGALINLANLYSSKEEYNKSELYYLEAKTIQEKVLGKDHPEYSLCLNNLANLYQDIGEFEKAEAFYLEAKEIRGKVFGKNHLEYANSLNSLASLNHKKGDLEKAEEFYLQAKNIEEKLLGKNHPDYANTINSLAQVYSKSLKYNKAEVYYLEAKIIRERVFGKEHYIYARSLNDLANLYCKVGQFKKAKEFYLEAISIHEKKNGKDSGYATYLNNLANLYYDTREYDKSESLNLEAKEIREKILGISHPDYARSLNSLANLYWIKEEYNKAEPMYLEVKDIWGEILGQDHPLYALCLNNLANLYTNKREYNKAEPMYLEAKDIFGKKLGKDNPDYAMSIGNLANLYCYSGQTKKAELYFYAASNTIKHILQKSLVYLPAEEIEQYIAQFQNENDSFYSFNHVNSSDSLDIESFNNALFYKSLGLEVSARLERNIQNTPDSIRDLHSLLKGYNYQLSAELSKSTTDRKNVGRLDSLTNALEKALLRAVPAFAETQRQIQSHDVRTSLQSNEAAIEIIHYRYHDKKLTDSTMYSALLLLPNDTSPHFIPLCEERQLDALIYKPNGTRANYLQNLYSSPRADGLTSLYQLIWAPIDKVLQENGVKTVYYAPSGLLHRLNLAAIAPDKSGQTLADQYHLVPVASTRQLVTDHSEANLPTSAIIYGGVRYEMDSTAIAHANKDLSATAQDTTGGLFRYAIRGGERADNWDTLPGTKREARYLYDLLSKRGVNATLRLGFAATEESFKQIGQQAPSPSLLHVGTHGFFFPDPKDTTRRRANLGDDAPVFKISEHPLIRSGLKLAGSKYAWENKRPMGGMEDGILTAYEVSQMNLSNTQLVVLSACETGLGDIKGNEGVYGLQRAFRIAGAKNVLMSLWKVPDEATEKLMTRFYANWLEQKMPLRPAFEAAQKWLRGQKGYENPYFWAGFVLIGEL